MMNHTEVLKNLKSGWTLYNKGQGYWLRDAHLNERFTREIFVRDRIVHDLERGNIVKIVVKNSSLIKVELNEH